MSISAMGYCIVEIVTVMSEEVAIDSCPRAFCRICEHLKAMSVCLPLQILFQKIVQSFDMRLHYHLSLLLLSFITTETQSH